MTRMVYTLYYLMRADFLERVRRYHFLLVLGLVGFAGYLLTPPAGSTYATLVRGSYRPLYNSAGIGNLFGSVAVIFLSLFGFYLVKNAIARDEQTGVGQIIASTPIRKPVYLLGKWLSNLAVLTVVLAVLTLIALVMQWVRAEDPQVNLYKLAAPIWLMGLPVLAVCSAFAVAFESIPFLRGSLGNAVAFFLWMGYLSSWAPSFASLATPSNDLPCLSRATASIQHQILEFDPNADISAGGMLWFQVPLIPGQPAYSAQPFTWHGLDWTGGLIFDRLLWIGLGVIITLAAAIPFDRFDSSLRAVKTFRPAQVPLTEAGAVVIEMKRPMRLSRLEQQSWRWRFFSILTAELRLMLKGQKSIWYLVALGLIIGMLLSPLEIVTSYLFPLVCLWPVALWAGMGGREQRHQTTALVLSTPHPLSRQLPALWLAGALVGLVTTGAAGLRFGLVGQWEHVLAWLVGVLFVPSLALALGVWSGGSKLFEVSYVALWYLGILQHIPALDFFGLTDLALRQGMPLLFAALTLLLVGSTLAGRWLQATRGRNASG